MQGITLVITTINLQSAAIKKYLHAGLSMIIVGDIKTPRDWLVEKNFVSTNQQDSYFPALSKSLAYNHYARKNIGYLLAMKKGDIIGESDDDTFPKRNYPGKLMLQRKVSSLNTRSNFFNHFRFFSKRVKVWPRGFPLRYIQSAPEYKLESKVGEFPLQSALIDGDSDFDAIYRLISNSPVRFTRKDPLAINAGTFVPVNTQNTFWHKQAWFFMYLPWTVSSRVCDIYRGYVAQRLLWELGYELLICPANTFQVRNPHDYIVDFKSELVLYTEIESLVATILKTRLSGGIDSKLVQVYTRLIEKGFVKKEELATLRLWIKEVSKLV